MRGTERPKGTDHSNTIQCRKKSSFEDQSVSENERILIVKPSATELADRLQLGLAALGTLKRDRACDGITRAENGLVVDLLQRGGDVLYGLVENSG